MRTMSGGVRSSSNPGRGRGRGACRGFTVLEVVLALALASLVVGGVFGLMSLLHSAEARHAARFQLIVDRAMAQEVLRKTLRLLFAAEPLPEPAPSATTGDRTRPEGAERPTGEEADAAREEEQRGADRDDRADIASLVRERLGQSDLADRIIDSMRHDEPPHFQLYIPDAGGGLTPGLPRLEVVLTESPVAIRPLVENGRVVQVARGRDTMVRGALEFALAGDVPGASVMQWRPIDPPGLPTVLLEGIDSALIEVLPRQAQGGEWAELWAAFLQEDYPVAVRVVLWMHDGSMIDWLFDTTVLSPSPPTTGFGGGAR